MLEVTSAEHMGGYRIWVEFNSGEKGEVDIEDALWGPVFEPVRNPAVFGRFRISPILHTITWKNDADLAPEFLRDKLIEQRYAAG